jgi:hypothetical protein
VVEERFGAIEIRFLLREDRPSVTAEDVEDRRL